MALTFAVAPRELTADTIVRTATVNQQVILTGNESFDVKLDLGSAHGMIDRTVQATPDGLADFDGYLQSLGTYLYALLYTTSSNVVFTISGCYCPPDGTIPTWRELVTFAITPSVPFQLNGYSLASPLAKCTIRNTTIGIATVEAFADVRSR